MGSVECQQPDLICLVENEAAQDKVLVRVGCLRRDVPPGVGPWKLQRRCTENAGMVRIQLEIEMFQNESNNGKDQDFKSYATSNLPHLNEHLSTAIQLQSALNVKAAGRGTN